MIRHFLKIISIAIAVIAIEIEKKHLREEMSEMLLHEYKKTHAENLNRTQIN